MNDRQQMAARELVRKQAEYLGISLRESTERMAQVLTDLSAPLTITYETGDTPAR